MSAQIASLHSPTQPAGLMVPSEVARKHQQAPPPAEEFLKFVKGLASKCGDEERDRDRRYYQRGTKNEMYYTGNQWGFFSKRTGQYTTREAGERDPIYTYNDFRYYSDAITTQWVQSRTALIVRPANRDDVHALGAAKVGSQILDHYEDRLLTEPFLQKEGKRGQFYGDMYRYSYWSLDAGGPMVERPQFAEQPLKLAQDAYTCASCGQSGALDPAQPGCQGCGSAEIVPTEVPETPLPLVSGYEQQRTGDLVCESVPPLEVKFDRTGDDFDEGLFVRRRRRVRRQIIKSLLPWWRGKSSTDADDTAMALQTATRRNVGNVALAGPLGTSAANDADMVTVDQWWFQPAMYAECEPLPRETKFECGLTIPAGVKPAEVFQAGLYMLLVNGEPVDFRDEDFRDHWQHTPFILVPGRPDGDGVEDMCEPQRQKNQTFSLIDLDNRYNAAPPTLLRSPFIKTSDWSGKPHENIPVQNAPLNVSLQEMIHRPATPGLKPQVFEFAQILDAHEQKYSKAWSSSTGAPDISQVGGNNTATGAQLMSTNAQAQRAPELALRAYGNKRCAEQWLRLFKRHCTDSRMFPADPKKSKGVEAKWFSAADVDCDLLVSVKKRSWLPRNEMDKRQDVTGFLQAIGMATQMGLPAQVQELVAESFNLDIDLTGHSAQVRWCRTQLDQMEQMLPQVSAMGAPAEAAGQMLAGAIQVMPDVEHIDQAVKFYQEWILSDEGSAADPALVMAARAMIAQYKQAQVAQAQEQQQMQIAASAPQMQMQQAMQAQQADQQAQQQAQQGDAERQHKAEMTDAQMQHNAAMSAQDQQHARAMQADKSASAERVAAMRQAGAGGGTGG